MKYAFIMSIGCLIACMYQIHTQSGKIKSLEDTIDYLTSFKEPLPEVKPNEHIKDKITMIAKRNGYSNRINVGEINTIAKYIDIYSAQYKVPEDLIISLIAQESMFDRKAVSYAGAIGLGQIMPSTAREIASELGVDKYDLTSIRDNIRFSVWYLKKMLKMFNGNDHLAIKAYNAGPNKVRKVLRGEDTYKEETEVYHKRIRNIYAMIY